MKKINLKKLLDISQKGQSLVEILVAIGLAAILLPALLTGVVASREGKAQEKERLIATGYMREMAEAARQFRETDWENFAINGTYYPQVVGTAWVLSNGTESLNGFSRYMVISDVQRDVGGAIVADGGTVDNSTKKVEYTVSWSGSYGGSITGTEYFTRFLANNIWNQTTQTDFNGGIVTDTITTNNSGGEVELDQSTGGDWALPELEGSFNNSGNNDPNEVFVSGNYAYLGTDNGNADFTVINISNPASPTLSGSLNLGGDINGIYVSGNYAYLASADNSKELTIINISNPSSPTEIGSYNLSGNQDVTDIFVSGNYAYLTRVSSGNPEFYSINISNPSSPSLSGSVNLSGNVNAVYVSGNTAFVATSDNSQELVAIDITNPASPTTLGSYNASSNSDANDVYVQDNFAYLVTQNNSGSGAELYILNVTNPSSITLSGSYDTGDNSNSVFISGTLAFIGNDNNSQEFQVVNVSTPASPALYGSLNLSNDIDSVFVAGDYAYLGSVDNSAELTVILGGSGDVYMTSGSFESSTFDAGSLVGFNYLTFTGSTPSGTTLTLQLAINNDNATWNYFGSYTTAGSIPLASINGRYIRYKALLTGEGATTPVLSDVSINYSP